jgi:ADP-ribosylglycohydrolase
MKNTDRYKAVILGLACGDALGKPTEFGSVKSIRSRFGQAGIQHINQTTGLFTDDTQMAVALAEGLLDSAIFAESILTEDSTLEERQAAYATLVNVPEQVMPHVAKRFVEWAFGPKNNRAPGNTCMAGCRALRDGKPWTESGVPNSRGCGSAMRAAPLGLVYKAGKTLKEMSYASSVVTHGHQAAQEAAHVAALAVRLLIEGTHPTQLLERLSREVTEPNFVKLMGRVEKAVNDTITGKTTPEEVQTFAGGLGESWVGDEAVASALYCFLLADAQGEGYVETVRYGANTDGDSDSIATICGSFAGAYWGLGGKGLPESWISHVEDSKYLGQLAVRLYDLSRRLA